jgi:putative SOS response-associated peptidase YedK
VGDDTVHDHEALLSSFGLISRWATDTKIAPHTYNARTETVAKSPASAMLGASRSTASSRRKPSLNPTGEAGRPSQPASVTRAACLWELLACGRGGKIRKARPMLTINANHHPLMNQFHKPADEELMIMILPLERYDDWLKANPSESENFLRAWPAELMAAEQHESPN